MNFSFIIVLFMIYHHYSSCLTINKHTSYSCHIESRMTKNLCSKVLQNFALSAHDNHHISLSKMKSLIARSALSIILINPMPTIVSAKSDLPALDKCFHAIEKELDPVNGESLNRLKNDIEKGDWDDMKLFTREYDAGFRGLYNIK